MRKAVRYMVMAAAMVLAGTAAVSAQKYPERGDIRKGNRDYEKGRYDQSEIRYRKAVEQNPESFEASYNLGNSLYRQGKWEGAESVFSETNKAETSKTNRVNSHFNAGNAMFQQRKLQEALEEYKQALRLNPNDMEAKFNLAYVKKLLEEEDGDGDGDDENDDNNDDKDNNNGDGNNNPDGDNNHDEGDGDQNPDEGKGDDKPDQGDGQPKERPSGMTREEAENLLDAMQGNEDRAKEKADEKKAAVPVASDKNW